MAPSQLAQLKSALSSSGLSSSSSKKKNAKGKSGGLTPKDREKKQQRLEEIKKTLNKFDVREGKVKFDVGGKGNTKLAKGVSGRPSESRSKGLEARKVSLLPEHQLRRTGHTGSFLDRRFGVADPTVTPEAAALARFTRAREASSKKSRFNLQDHEEGLGFGGDDEDMHLGKLTHGGRSIDELRGDDFLMQGLDDDDDEVEDDFGIGSSRRQADLDGEGMIAAAAATSRRPRFGENADGEDGEERKKTKAEVMAEVILKSKTHKYERQQQKELDEDLRHQLDLDLSDLRSLLAPTTKDPETGFLTSTTSAFDPNKTGTNDLPLGRPSRMAAHIPGTDDKPTEEAGKTADDMDYDQYVRSLAFDRRAKPKDRIKSEEELAKEESDQLLLLEKNRLRRMQGLSPEVEADTGGKRKRRRGEEEVVLRKKKGKGRAPEADDLSDDFVMSGDEMDEDDEEEGAFGLGRGLRAAGNGEEMVDLGSDSEETEEDEEDDEGEDNDMEDSEDEDQDGHSATDDDQDLIDETADFEETIAGSGANEDTHESLLAPSMRKSKAKAAAREIPYAFECPADHDDLLDILDGLQEKDVEIVIKRIRALYHPSLGEGNKERLEGLLGVLLDHVLDLAASDSPTAFSTISLVTPHIISLVALNPIPAAHHFTSKISLMQKNLARGLARGPILNESRTFPGKPELALLRLVGLVWSTSDFSNPVGAPAELLMGQYLAQGAVRRLEDLGSGLFLCSLFLQYESFSKRLVPEVINFLCNTLVILSPKSARHNRIPGSFPIGNASDSSATLRLRSKVAATLLVRTADLPVLLSVGQGNTEDQEQAKIDLLAVAVRLVGKFSSLYIGLGAFLEVFTPLKELLDSLVEATIPATLKLVIQPELEKLTNLLKQSSRDRRPLQMQDHKPVAIRTYTPKFEASFSARKHNDPDAERNASAKLKALYKKEKKGAIRELRKDTKFLAGERAREQKAKDEEYTKKMRRVEGEIATTERAEEKAMEREKNRDKRRAGGRK